MRQYRWLYPLLIITLLLSSCRATGSAASNLEPQTASIAKVNPLTVSILARKVKVTARLEENECLNCHEDKERLIETAKVQEVVESESSGVG